MQVASGTAEDGYTVKKIANCRIVFGQIPVSDLMMLTGGFSKKSVMDLSIASRIGATIVIGEPEDIEVLRGINLPVSAARQADYLAANELGIRNSVSLWLRNGERGSSSEAMCKHIFGVPAEAGKSHPHDPDDLRRCVLFLEQTDSSNLAYSMRDVSPEWTALVDHWDELTGLLRQEMTNPKGGARQTYDRMKAVLDKA
jgi:hypothetical protein